MKLRTELVNYRITTIPPKDVKQAEGSHEALRRDALAAHALLQAMEGACQEWKLPANYFKARADEIMREWTWEAER